MNCGLYKIINKTNGKFYIGSSNDIHNRFVSHVRNLKKNKHCNRHLQSAWNIDGENNFYINPYKECDVKLLKEEEQKELDIWVGNDLCYNINKNADRLVGIGEKRERWIVDKIRKSNLGKHRTDEQKLQMSKLKIGTKHTTETIEKMKRRKSNYINIKNAQKFNDGRIYNQSHCDNISKSLINKHIIRSDDVRNKIKNSVIKSIKEGKIGGRGHLKILRNEYTQIKKLYFMDKLSVKKISQIYNVGYMYMWKLLKKLGVK